MKAKYIAFEGIDGSGKTKQLSLLENYLVNQGYKVLITKEFGSLHDDACINLREFALNSKYGFDELTGQFLFAACSSQHSEKVLTPALEEYDFILSDRSIESNLAYGPPALAEAYSDKFTLDQLRETIYNLFFLDQRRVSPDSIIYLNVDPEVTWSRIGKREQESFKDGVDRIEDKGLQFQRLVKEEYARRLEQNKNYVAVDCNNLTIEQTHQQILKQLKL